MELELRDNGDGTYTAIVWVHEAGERDSNDYHATANSYGEAAKLAVDLYVKDFPLEGEG